MNLQYSVIIYDVHDNSQRNHRKYFFKSTAKKLTEELKCNTKKYLFNTKEGDRKEQTTSDARHIENRARWQTKISSYQQLC